MPRSKLPKDQILAVRKADADNFCLLIVMLGALLLMLGDFFPFACVREDNAFASVDLFFLTDTLCTWGQALRMCALVWLIISALRLAALLSPWRVDPALRAYKL